MAFPKKKIVRKGKKAGQVGAREKRFSTKSKRIAKKASKRAIKSKTDNNNIRDKNCGDDFKDYKKNALRMCGPLSHKLSSELFVIEKSGETKNELLLEEVKPKVLELKAYKALDNSGGHPAFVPGSKRKNRGTLRSKVKDEKPERELLQSDRKAVLPNFKRGGKKNWALKREQKLGETDSNGLTLFKDVWDEVPIKLALNRKLEDFYLRQTKKKMVNLPNTRSRLQTVLPKVEVPHPGVSYNPAFDDHQEYVANLTEIEVKKLAKEEALNKKLALSKDQSYATQFTRELEEAEGIFRDQTGKLLKEESEDAELDAKEGNGETYTPAVAPVSAESRKVKAQRRKEQRAKEIKQKKLREKVEKKRIHDVYRLKHINKELKTEAAETAARITRREERKAKKLASAAKLSKIKFEDPEKPVQLLEELSGSLRLLKPEGSLLQDRFRSLQKRNVIEVRERQNFKRKFPLKSYTKRSHKKDEICDRLWKLERKDK